ncbi:MAG TPA: SH3 domain-containing protein [Devosia sp.]
MRSIKILATAISISLLGMSIAEAAQATTSLNVRSGPGTSYGVVDTLFAGENVDVEECRSNGWCRISHSGPDGWVSARYLTDTGGGGRVIIDDDEGPDVNFSIRTPNFSFSIGNGGDFRQRPGFPRRFGQVCFYEHVNFGGARLCARPGESAARLGSFNDRISSIRIRGDAEVQVCEHVNFQGRCAVLDRSRPNLGGRNNDIISSYRVR